MKEFEQRGKSSEFVGKRIGEKNEDLDEFGKAVLRSQRELQVVFSWVGYRTHEFDHLNIFFWEASFSYLMVWGHG